MLPGPRAAAREAAIRLIRRGAFAPPATATATMRPGIRVTGCPPHWRGLPRRPCSDSPFQYEDEPVGARRVGVSPVFERVVCPAPGGRGSGGDAPGSPDGVEQHVAGFVGDLDGIEVADGVGGGVERPEDGAGFGEALGGIECRDASAPEGTPKRIARSQATCYLWRTRATPPWWPFRSPSPAGPLIIWVSRYPTRHSWNQTPVGGKNLRRFVEDFTE